MGRMISMVRPQSVDLLAHTVVSAATLASLAAPVVTNNAPGLASVVADVLWSRLTAAKGRSATEFRANVMAWDASGRKGTAVRRVIRRNIHERYPDMPDWELATLIGCILSAVLDADLDNLWRDL